MNDKWLNDLREHLDGYEQPAPENLWERIAEAMPSAKPDPAPALSRKIIPLWSKRAAAAAAAIAVVATVGYGWLTRNDSAPQPISVQYADNTPAVEQSPQPLFNGSTQLATQQNV